MGVLKLNKKQVNEIMKKEGYELLSEEYTSSHNPIIVKCNKGHIYETNYHRWQTTDGYKGKRCPYCYGNKRYTIEQVTEYCNTIGYTLLSKEYKNNRTKMDFICDKGHEYRADFDSLKGGHRCFYCMKKGRNSSPQEAEIVNIVKECVNTKIVENDKTTILNPKTNKYFELDIWMPELRKAIEFNSEYWHRSRLNNDLFKIEYCKSNKIGLLVIWYEDWVKNSNICKEMIKEFVLNE